ncbi:MAG: arginine--tRNA ligase [Candidatus Marinimicrobia bacterium]|jgi:arginyl-tRNA synthetase|nr:arginine--tRNA ligase [Candidatus Neomarinimicrobiota bacterium]MBT5116082.1 arginine--tRNA ligase [Candidatus Neomarinimicrobiota bacterium]MBT7515055.1 arginine--tRNA ligase [Candidatus Neomarinimicrobiota bacterium]|tara:strand:- start:3592 stop:5226 length:1635 start_codon:yes stop_codon:yes gene_type:complete
MKLLKQQISKAVSTSITSLSYPEKDFSLAPPKNPDFGDLSTNISLLLTRDLKKSPLEIANNIANILNQNLPKYVSKVTVTPPGFINFKISDSFYQSNITTILDAGNSYGKGSVGKRKTANVEFVSANPTGPLTVGHGRNAVLGDTVSSILEWQGFEVTREYYFNDAGRQMRILGQSVEARYFEILGKEFKFPDDGYEGSYIKKIAQSIIKDKGSNLPSGDSNFKEKAEDSIFEDIKKSLLNLGIHFNQFTNEKTFYENGEIDKFLGELRSKELIYEKKNATWFKTTALGMEKDRVFIKSSGEPTYRVPDTAYHRNKIERGFDLIIDIFGADHADTYPDVLLALKSLGLKTDHIRVLLYQFVTLIRGGEKVKMSTRKANFVTMDELVNEVGTDVVRYFFVMRSMNTHLDFDLDLATDQSDKNPVFYLQYAHARICNIIKHGRESGLELSDKFESSLLSHPEEINLLRHMVRFPEFMELAYENLEPQIVANYLQELATRFHKFYSHCHVITDDLDLSKARLALITSVNMILLNGLNILGISAPERM